MHPRPTALMVAALTTIMAVPALSAPAHAASAAEKARAHKTNVYVQGDSLTVGAGPYLRRNLGGDVHRVAIDAAVGRFAATGMSRLAHSGSAHRSTVWVVALGTNDGPDPQALRQHVVRSLQLAGPNREVIWLTVERPGAYSRVNAMLRQLDHAQEQLHVVDWARHVHAHRGLLAGDGVHATATGYQVRAALIARTARALAQQP